MQNTALTGQKLRFSKKAAVEEGETVQVTLNVPKSLMKFFEKTTQSIGSPQGTVEEQMLAALIDGVDATLNDLDKKSRENIIHNLELDKILQ